MHNSHVRGLQDLVRSAISALSDLEKGYPWKELHVDVGTLRVRAMSLGVELDDEDWCSECGANLDLEGWDGWCGMCADLFERGET